MTRGGFFEAKRTISIRSVYNKSCSFITDNLMRGAVEMSRKFYGKTSDKALLEHII